MINVLKTLKNEFKALNIPYSYDNWEKDVILPYFVGDLMEITTNDEDLKREFSFTLIGEDVGTYTNLYNFTEILKREYKQSKTITLDNGLVKIIYNKTTNIPVEDKRIKRVETEFTILLWESESIKYETWK